MEISLKNLYVDLGVERVKRPPDSLFAVCITPIIVNEFSVTTWNYGYT